MSGYTKLFGNRLIGCKYEYERARLTMWLW